MEAASGRPLIATVAYDAAVDSSPSIIWRLVGESIGLLFRAAPGYEAHLTPHACLALSGEPAADLNVIVVDGGPEPHACLRTHMERVRSRDLPVMVLLTGKVAEPLAPAAAELGLAHAGGMPLMVCTPTAPGGGSDRFTVERITSDGERRTAVSLAAAAFSLPPDVVERACGTGLLDAPGFDYFVARRFDGTPVSSVQTTRSGSAVGIWVMATPPQHQRQGAGRALLEGVMAHHLERGAELFYLGATAAGLPLYESVGFHTIDEAAVWLRGESTQVPAPGPDA